MAGKEGKLQCSVTLYYIVDTTSTVNAIDLACSALYVARATSAKFGPHAGTMKFNKQAEE
jgi:hypothetical protein